MHMHATRRISAVTAAITLYAVTSAGLGGANALRKLAGASPVAPSNCQVTPTVVWAPPATVTWTDNSNNEDGFVVEWWISGKLQSSVTVGPDTTFAYMGRTSKAPNRYRVKGFNAYGDSAWSNWAHIK